MRTFGEDLLLTIIDKGLLAIVALCLGFVLRSVLQRRKAREELLQAISPERVTAYKALWLLTEPLRPSAEGEISTEARTKLSETLTTWYYVHGGGMFLSHRAASLFMGARETLDKANVPASDVRTAFSRLRSQLKFDCGIYSETERDTNLRW